MNEEQLAGETSEIRPQDPLLEVEGSDLEPMDIPIQQMAEQIAVQDTSTHSESTSNALTTSVNTSQVEAQQEGMMDAGQLVGTQISTSADELRKKLLESATINLSDIESDESDHENELGGSLNSSPSLAGTSGTLKKRRWPVVFNVKAEDWWVQEERRKKEEADRVAALEAENKRLMAEQARFAELYKKLGLSQGNQDIFGDTDTPTFKDTENISATSGSGSSCGQASALVASPAIDTPSQSAGLTLSQFDVLPRTSLVHTSGTIEDSVSSQPPSCHHSEKNDKAQAPSSGITGSHFPSMPSIPTEIPSLAVDITSIQVLPIDSIQASSVDNDNEVSLRYFYLTFQN